MVHYRSERVRAGNGSRQSSGVPTGSPACSRTAHLDGFEVKKFPSKANSESAFTALIFSIFGNKTGARELRHPASDRDSW
jgi:hypothetical protein